MTQDDWRYFERRWRETKERAENASNPAIAAVYRSFAEHYAREIGRLGMASNDDHGSAKRD